MKGSLRRVELVACWLIAGSEAQSPEFDEGNLVIKNRSVDSRDGSSVVGAFILQVAVMTLELKGPKVWMPSPDFLGK